MSHESDIADYRRLEAEVAGSVVSHRSYRSNPNTGERKIKHEETWHRGQFLGHGSCGTVLLEENSNDKNKLRAVKILSKCRGVSRSFDPFDEAVVMSILSRPENEALFVKFYGWYETEDTVCLVMEYIKHGDLNNYLYKNGPLQDDDASAVTKQLLEGLEAIHQAGFVHRDLKPDNILIQHTAPWWVKISDFGISRRLKDRIAVTYTGGGTNGFKAPEISFDTRTQHTTAIDMWSLGCVTYNSLTNAIPFENDRELARFRKDSSSFYERLDGMSFVTANAKTFMRALIVIEPHMRATAAMAMTQSWITGFRSRPNPPSTSDESSESEQSIRTPTFSSTEIVSGRLDDQSNVSQAHEEMYAQSQAFHQPNLVNQADAESKQTDLSPNSLDAASIRRSQYSVDDDIALLESVEKSDIAVVSFLLDRGAFVDKKDDNGRTALMWASYNANERIVHVLLDRGAKIDIRANDGWTALIWAVYHGRDMIVRVLLDRGANVDANDNNSRTGLMWAACNKREKIVHILLDRSASIDAMDKSGRTALIWAASNGHDKIVHILLDRAASVNAKDNDGRTALLWAARYGHDKIVRVLLDWGIDTEAKDSDGWTALLWAGYNGYEMVVRILLEHSADATIRSYQNETAYEIASRRGWTAVMSLLSLHGAS